MRRYDDPVEVRRDGSEAPEQFLWRGRLWKVRLVLARWIETGAWWQSSEVSDILGVDDADGTADGAADGAVQARGQVLDLLGEREMWRVEAGRGGLELDGVFELSFDASGGRWSLVGCLD